MKSIFNICMLFFIGKGFIFSTVNAQFIDHFDGPYDPFHTQTPEGWTYATGDGLAEIEFLQMDGYASILVDATKDNRNIWWALVRCQVTGLSMQDLIKPENELRVEARIRLNHAPRRVNLHFNHQRTTDFHSHLMEYDIPDTVNWHTISMTTQGFETQVGDRINVQMALMDWGLGKYRIDIDYIKVHVVNKNAVEKDLGAKLPYHPPVADPGSFEHHIPVYQDGMIDAEFTGLNFNDWKTRDPNGETILLTVNRTQVVILRWDLSSFKGKKIEGSGLLELTTHTLQHSPQYQKDFGMIRVTEILGGDPDWNQETVTMDSFLDGNTLNQVLNPQMVIDWEVNRDQGGKTLFTISRPVLQRMIDGRTRGLAIRPLGAVVASFYAMENQQEMYRASLYFNVE
jgi:hypothetical protein